MDDTERQKQHAANIASENNLMQTLKCTRGQAFETIRQFRKSQAEDERAKAKEKQPDANKPTEPVKIDIDVTKFAQRPLTLDGGRNQNNNSQQVGGKWYSLTLCDGTTLEVRAQNIVPP